MKNIIIFILLTNISLITNANANSNSYKKLTESLETLDIEDGTYIGEDLYLKEKSKKSLELRITSLLSWTYSAKQKESIKLTSGIFAMLAPEKNKLTSEYEKNNYFSFFLSDQFGSSFLYKDYIVTNYHMCRGLNTLIRDFNNKLYAVKVLAYDIEEDICILKAPNGVKNQRNFATYKMPLNIKLEEERSLKIDFKINKLMNKRNFTKEDKIKILQLEEDKKSLKRDYGYISGAYGEFYIYDIKKDHTVDNFSKKNGYIAKGEKCKSGVSGSPVVSAEGLIGLFWGAETIENRSTLKKIKRSVSFFNKKNDIEQFPACFFVSKDAVDKVIENYEKKQQQH